MGTLLASTVGGRYPFPGSFANPPNDSASPCCIICAAIFCYTFAMTIFFSLKQEALFGVLSIIVVSIILLYAACRKKVKKTLPRNRIEFETENMVKIENKTLSVQRSRIDFGKANVVAFFNKIKQFLFPKKTETPTTNIQSSLAVATYSNTILV